MGERHGKIFLNKNAFCLSIGIGLSTFIVEHISIEVCQRTNGCVSLLINNTGKRFCEEEKKRDVKDYFI
jgi:hypothetical protein